MRGTAAVVINNLYSAYSMKYGNEKQERLFMDDFPTKPPSTV